MQIIIYFCISIVVLFANDNTNVLLNKANSFIQNNKIQKAIDIYRELVKKDITAANFNLGLIYGFGINGIDKDNILAKKYLSKATSKYHKKAPYFSSLILSDEEDVNETKIIMLMLESAVSGFDKAQLEFGKILLDMNKTEASKEWIDKARKQGNMDAEALWHKLRLDTLKSQRLECTQKLQPQSNPTLK